MNVAIARSLSTESLRSRYRQLMALRARAGWGAGFAGATCAALGCAAVGASPAAGLLVWLLVAATVTDLLWRRIFNSLLVTALGCVLLQIAAAGGAAPASRLCQLRPVGSGGVSW